MRRERGIAAAAATLALVVVAGTAHAGFTVPAAEAEKLKRCEKLICERLVKKDKAMSDVSCDASKTWASKFIEKGIKEKSVRWGLGDARCSLTLSVANEALVKAVTEADYVLEMAPQTAACDAETSDGVTSVKITLAPKLTFKAGKATQVSLNVGEIDAPAIVKQAIWSVATIEDTVGLFHSQTLDEVNEFIHERCPAAMK